MTDFSALAPLRRQARSLQDRAHAPFSGRPTAAIALLDDGSWIPGVRMESASYSLTLPALINAYTTAVTLGREEALVAMVLSRPHRREEHLYVDELPGMPFKAWADDAWIRSSATTGSLPAVQSFLPPFLGPSVEEPSRGVLDARRAADRAYVPASGFGVGAVLELNDGQLVPGVNVEHTDWARILCAERNALGTALSYDTASPNRLYLSCMEDSEGSPCGACRQVLTELAPDLDVWMDRHDAPPEHAALSALLPGSFQGEVLLDGR